MTNEGEVETFRPGKTFSTKKNMPRDIESKSDRIKAVIAFGIEWITKKDAGLCFGIQFMCCVWCEQWETLTANGFQIGQIRIFMINDLPR